MRSTCGKARLEVVGNTLNLQLQNVQNKVTFLSQNLSLLAYISEVLSYRCQDVCYCFHFCEHNKSTNKTPKHNITLIILLSYFQLFEDIHARILQ